MRVIEKKVMSNTEELSEKARASDRAATGDAVEELQAEASQQPNASKTATGCIARTGAAQINVLITNCRSLFSPRHEPQVTV